MTTQPHPICPVLLVDDELEFLTSCELLLKSVGIKSIITCNDSLKVLPLLKEKEIELVILDISMPNLSGQEILEEINTGFPDIPVIMVTAIDDLDTAVDCIKKGASEYLIKPLEENRFISTIKKTIEIRELKRENRCLTQGYFDKKLKKPEVFNKIITSNLLMKSVFHYIEAIGNSTRPVLITGETGTGKELIAKAVHTLSGCTGRFVSLNIAGYDNTMIADSLFGHTKGAFTGADYKRTGMIERAEGGTLFLDEIGDMDLPSQIKLLRLIQENEYYRLGSDIPMKANVRIITATHQPLEKLMNEKKFRNDLYYRLKNHTIHLPSLRERKTDIPLLVDYFLERASQSIGKPKPATHNELYTLLSTYPFPGNIRELENMVFDAVTQHKRGILSQETFKKAMGLDKDDSSAAQDNIVNPGLAIKIDNNSDLPFPTLKATEHFLIKEAMVRAEENQTIAARMLGISRTALNRRLRNYN